MDPQSQEGPRHLLWQRLVELKSCPPGLCWQNEVRWSETKTIEPTDPLQGPITEPNLKNTTTEILTWLVFGNVLVVCKCRQWHRDTSQQC